MIRPGLKNRIEVVMFKFQIIRYAVRKELKRVSDGGGRRWKLQSIWLGWLKWGRESDGIAGSFFLGKTVWSKFDGELSNNSTWLYTRISHEAIVIPMFVLDEVFETSRRRGFAT